ncbi:Fpg/Nei family DNA glycosylase [Streptomyces sp. NPDC001651]|uniref:Fpg/Nei family DNA glycosylase n=1 Tax=Streptomyces sp. NPDC001651 TaxID=3364596 RepID=UPI0036A539AF
MPELPDVEGFRGVLRSCAQGRTVRRIEVRDAGVLHGVSARRLREALEGRRITRAERHGKWLLARTGGPTLALHFGMTGSLVCAGPDDPVAPHDRVLFTLSGDRRLRYRDQRKLQGLWLAEDAAAVARLLAGQGPDALDVDRERFDEALRGRRGAVKGVLLDQSAVAGLGNLLADEILWRARLSPARRASDLTDADRRGLYRQMRRTLRSAVPTGRVPPRPSWLTGRRDTPDPHCPRCHAPLRRTRVAGRTTVWCAACQPATSGAATGSRR